MKILHLCKSLQTHLGGIQTHTRALTAALAQQGISVSVLTGAGWRGEKPQPGIDGVEIIPLRQAPGHRLRGVRRLSDDVAFNLAAMRWLRREQRHFDLIHVQGRSGLGHAALGRHLRPVVMTFHGLTKEEYRYARHGQTLSQDEWLHQTCTHPLERWAYRRAQGVITVSNFMAGQLEAYFGRQPQVLRVISNGVSSGGTVASAPMARPEARRWVTFLGRLEENKGVRLLPAILAQLPSGMGLRVIGTGRLGPWLQAKLQQQGLWERVDWVGPIPNLEVPAWLLDSFALVVPSLYEPQGLVVLEAFAQAVPVIASDVGGLREMVRSGVNGWLVPPGEPLAVAQLLGALHERPEWAARLGKAGQRMVHHQYPWTQVAAQTHALYESILSGYHPPDLTDSPGQVQAEVARPAQPASYPSQPGSFLGTMSNHSHA